MQCGCIGDDINPWRGEASWASGQAQAGLARTLFRGASAAVAGIYRHLQAIKGLSGGTRIVGDSQEGVVYRSVGWTVGKTTKGKAGIRVGKACVRVVGWGVLGFCAAAWPAAHMA